MIAQRLATGTAVRRALAQQPGTALRLGELLVRHGDADPEAVARALAGQLHLPYLAPPLAPTRDVVRLIDPDMARRRALLPLEVRNRRVRVAMADPLDQGAISDLEFRLGSRVDPVVVSPQALARALTASVGGALSDLIEQLPSTPTVGAREALTLERQARARPVVQLVDHILEEAIHAGASDIHVQEEHTGLDVRYRVDGILRTAMTLPPESRGAVLSRLKIMAGMDIAEKRRPQDGGFLIKHRTGALTCRASTLPAERGEKAVLRLLNAVDAPSGLDDVGLCARDMATVRGLLQAGQGLILLAGPTGSGKSTTLFAALSEVDRGRLNVVTLEDPIEYRVPGVTHVQVNRAVGHSFPGLLRHVLRQDPDVIMVGEIRDPETARIATAAAVTGHLVLSTIHTLDAPSAVTRLLQMDVPRYLVAGGLSGVVAQRLVRRRCGHCGGVEAGCARCVGGYRGRSGVFQVLRVTDALRLAISDGASLEALRSLAKREGTRTLLEDAQRKIAEGDSSPHEVARVLGTAPH